MKKHLVLLSALLLQAAAVSVFAQDKVQHEYVDLGLSVMWATCNIGADAPEDYGEYYAWGETETKKTYKWSTYKWCEGNNLDSLTLDNSLALTKYNNISSCGIVDNKTILRPEDDVAHIKWGGSWRMPSVKEFQELIENCTWTWTSLNGVDGYRVTSKIAGYTDRSIFLPEAGGSWWAGPYAGLRGNYWSSSLKSEYPDGAVIPESEVESIGYSLSAFNICFSSEDVSCVDETRCFGLSVRPVFPKMSTVDVAADRKKVVY